MISKTVGQLSQDENFDDWWNSQPTEIPYLENKSLTITFTEPEDETYLRLADEAISNFIHLTTADREKHSNQIVKNYNDNLIYDYTPRLDLKSDNEIWQYVYPNEIMLEQNENGEMLVIVSCGCEWEVEHGLQLVFKNGNVLSRVSGHDGHYED